MAACYTVTRSVRKLFREHAKQILELKGLKSGQFSTIDIIKCPLQILSQQAFVHYANTFFKHFSGAKAKRIIPAF